MVATVLSLTVRPILLDRSLIGVSGPLFVLLAWAAVRTWAHPLTRIVAVATVTSMLIGLVLTYPAAPRPHSLQPVVDRIFAERQPGKRSSYWTGRASILRRCAIQMQRMST